VTEPTVYTVTARRWARGWELHIANSVGDEIGVTQARALSGAAAMVRDYLEVDDRPAADAIYIVPELGDELRQRVDAARAAVRRAAEEQERAATASRAAVQELRDAGLSGSEIAAVLEVSPQRVSQLSRRGSAAKVDTKSAVAKTRAKRESAAGGVRVTSRATGTGRFGYSKSGSAAGRPGVAAQDGSAQRVANSKKKAR
jgi:hypothetical protein